MSAHKGTPSKLSGKYKKAIKEAKQANSPIPGNFERNRQDDDNEPILIESSPEESKSSIRKKANSSRFSDLTSVTTRQPRRNSTILAGNLTLDLQSDEEDVSVHPVRIVGQSQNAGETNSRGKGAAKGKGRGKGVKKKVVQGLNEIREDENENNFLTEDENDDGGDGKYPITDDETDYYSCGDDKGEDGTGKEKKGTKKQSEKTSAGTLKLALSETSAAGSSLANYHSTPGIVINPGSQRRPASHEQNHFRTPTNTASATCKPASTNKGKLLSSKREAAPPVTPSRDNILVQESSEEGSDDDTPLVRRRLGRTVIRSDDEVTPPVPASRPAARNVNPPELLSTSKMNRIKGWLSSVDNSRVSVHQTYTPPGSNLEISEDRSIEIKRVDEHASLRDALDENNLEDTLPLTDDRGTSKAFGEAEGLIISGGQAGSSTQNTPEVGGLSNATGSYSGSLGYSDNLLGSERTSKAALSSNRTSSYGFSEEGGLSSNRTSKAGLGSDRTSAGFSDGTEGLGSQRTSKAGHSSYSSLIGPGSGRLSGESQPLSDRTSKAGLGSCGSQVGPGSARFSGESQPLSDRVPGHSSSGASNPSYHTVRSRESSSKESFKTPQSSEELRTSKADGSWNQRQSVDDNSSPVSRHVTNEHSNTSAQESQVVAAEKRPEEKSKISSAHNSSDFVPLSKFCFNNVTMESTFRGNIVYGNDSVDIAIVTEPISTTRSKPGAKKSTKDGKNGVRGNQDTKKGEKDTNATIDNSVNAVRAWTSTIEREVQGKVTSQTSERVEKFCGGQKMISSDEEEDEFDNYLSTLKAKKKVPKDSDGSDDDFIVPDDELESSDELSSPKLSLADRIRHKNKKSGKKLNKRPEKPGMESDSGNTEDGGDGGESDLPKRKRIREKQVTKERVLSPVLKSSIPDTPDTTPTTTTTKDPGSKRRIETPESLPSLTKPGRKRNETPSWRPGSTLNNATPDSSPSLTRTRRNNVKKSYVIRSDSSSRTNSPISSSGVTKSSSGESEPVRPNLPVVGKVSTPVLGKVAPSTTKKVGTPVMRTPKTKPKIQSDEALSTPKTLTFLSSLTMDTPKYRCHPDAVQYTTNFKKKKEELAKRLYALYNKEIFEYCLPGDMEIKWNVKLTKTAGLCYSRRYKNKFGIEIRSSRLELSTKVIDSGDRLRDTLIHEMCHAASWIISGYRDGHGPQWRCWAEKAMQRFPELPVIDRCHSYQINTKYNYVCQSCGYSIGRHSKSLDTEKKVCGHCHGRFQLVVNNKTSNKENNSQKGTAPPRTPNPFAQFTKDNYHKYRKPGVQHKDVMSALSLEFKKIKIQQQKSTKGGVESLEIDKITIE